MIYYRKLEHDEIPQPGDLFGDGCDVRTVVSRGMCNAGTHHHYFRPVTITEAKPEPPAHRVEDETWSCWDDTRILTDYLCHREIVCIQPPEIDMGWNRWSIRKQRICAGQEALKFIEKYGGRAWALDFKLDEMQRILALLK